MDLMHIMVPEDEIFLCGAALLYGLIAGGLARMVVSWRAARARRAQ